MKKIKMVVHGGSKNHGCEAIIRGTLNILQPKDAVVYSYHRDDDTLYELDKVVKIEDDNIMPAKWSVRYLWYVFNYKLRMRSSFQKDEYYRKTGRQHIFRSVTENDIMLSVGGDNYSYENVSYLADYNYGFQKEGAKTVLWGCSVEPKVIDEKAKRDLQTYSLIVARESLSYTYLQQINPNTVLKPDPAFTLRADKSEIPLFLQKHKCIGINISPMISFNERKKGIVLKNYIKLVKYIIEHTDYHVVLVPHVVINWSDDRISIKELCDAIEKTDRLHVLEDMPCEKLKGCISQCEFFVGARTHATIAAYSTCVPTLVLGYSIKSRGIAKDIFGTEKEYVLPVDSLINEDGLLLAYQKLFEKRENIKAYLKAMMPQYIQSAYDLKQILDVM